MSEIKIDALNTGEFCQHGNISSTCTKCKEAKSVESKENKTNRKEITPQERTKQLKEIQTGLIREWASKQNPPLVEGTDFRFITDIHALDFVKKENISSHEMSNLYFLYLKKHFQKIKTYFETDYSKEMLNVRKNKRPELFSTWSSEVARLNYSWAGRYMVEGTGGQPVDSGPVDALPISNETPTYTHNSEFKSFFKEKTGFEMPTPEELDEVAREMVKALPWYNKALELCKNKNKLIDALPEEQQNKLLPPGGWESRPNLPQLEYIIKILENVKNPEKWTNGHYFQELPDKIVSIEETSEKIRHHSDFTYNIDDWFNLDFVTNYVGDELEKAGFERTLPDSQRCDRIFQAVGQKRGDKKMQLFDRNKIEEIEKQFSEKLYPPEKAVE